MSDWSEGWYRGEQGHAAAHQAGSAGTGPGNAGWPDQPPMRSSAPTEADPYSPTTPGRQAYQGGGGRRWRFWGQPGRRGRRIALIASLVIVFLILATVGTYFWMDSKLNRSVTLPAFSGQSRGENWLITGSDSRQGLSRAQIDALHVGFDFGTLNSDSIMLLHLGGPKPVLISIPRDSYVPIPGHGYNKMNAALAFGGATLLIQTVENVTGLRIDHYMGIGFGGLVSVVNQIGGVQICLKTAIPPDQNSGLNLSAGCHNLNGTQALAFVRDRHSFATEDLQRIQDQRVFLSALLKKATSPGVYLNAFTMLPFGSSAASSLSVDKGMHLWSLVQAAFALRAPQTGTVPIANANYITSNAGDAVQWNQAQALQLFNALKNNQAVPNGLLGGTTVG